MTQRHDYPAQFALHVSVAARRWLYHLANSREAIRFLHERVAARRTTLLAVEGIEAQVVLEISAELRDDLDVSLAESIGDDVLTIFAEMQQTGILEIAPQPLLIRGAFLTTTTALHHIPFADAVAVTLAESSGAPLLVASEAVYQALKPLESVKPDLQVAWLPEYLDP